MKRFLLVAGLALSVLAPLAPLPAQPDKLFEFEPPGLASAEPLVCSPAAATPPAAVTGEFVVTLDLLVSETGAVEEAKLVSSDDKNLDGIAQKIANGLKLPVHQKDGAPVKYRATVPLTFPVEGDGGPDAQNIPLPRPTAQPGPQFPFEPSRDRTSGGVILELAVDAKGKLQDVKVVRSTHATFAKAALTAVRKWKFEPAQKDGQAVAAKFFQAVVFEAASQKTDWRWYVAPRPRLPEFIVSGHYITMNEAQRLLSR